jgi:hypothetical protein
MYRFGFGRIWNVIFSERACGILRGVGGSFTLLFDTFTVNIILSNIHLLLHVKCLSEINREQVYFI